MGVQVELRYSNMFVWMNAKILLVKQISLLCFSPQNRLYLHVKWARLGQASPLEGRPQPQALLQNVSVVWPPWNPGWCTAVQSNFFSPCVCTLLHLHKPFLSCPLLWECKSNWLIYLLSVKPFPISGIRWKKEKVRESDSAVSVTDTVHAQAALHTSCGRWYFDIFLQNAWSCG